MSSSPVYRAGVIGVGWGGTHSVRGLEESDRFDLVAVCDRLPGVRRRLRSSLRPEVRVWEDYPEMLRQGDLDVVCVATYPTTHEEIALDAMSAGIAGILVEKPVAISRRSGDRILEEALRRRMPLVVPHGLVTLGAVQKIIEMTRLGQIGDIRLIEIESAQTDLINAGIHWLHFCVELLSPDSFSSVLACCDTSSMTYREGVRVETESVTLARTNRGVRVVLNAGDAIPISGSSNIVIRLIGTTGLIEFWGWDGSYKIVSPGCFDLDAKVANPPVAFHRAYLEDLAHQIDSGQANYVPVQRSLAALEVCEAAYISHKLRCTVELPLTEFVAPLVQPWDVGSAYDGRGGKRDGRLVQMGIEKEPE